MKSGQTIEQILKKSSQRDYEERDSKPGETLSPDFLVVPEILPRGGRRSTEGTTKERITWVNRGAGGRGCGI